MTDLINRKKFIRFKVLNALFEATEGDTSKWKDLEPLASKEGIINGSFMDTYNYLKDEKLITLYGAGYTCFISHTGRKEIEAIYSNPTQPTEHFQSLKAMGL
jgi:hypothetical protein